MKYRKVTAIVNPAALESVEKALRHAGVGGITVSPVRGFGEYANFYGRDWMTGHVRIEVFTTESGARTVIDAIMDAASTGRRDDGILAVEPVLELYRIRTRQPVDDLRA